MRSLRAMHLVQLVADEDQTVAVLGHLAQRLEEFVDFLRRQHGGRLVQDEQGRAAVERLDDLDALSFAHGQRPDRGFRVRRCRP